MKQKNHAPRFGGILREGLALCARCEFPFFLFNNAMAVFHGVSFGATMFARKWFFDSAANACAGTGTLARAAGMLGVFALFLMAQQALNGACNFLTGCWFERFGARVKMRLSEKAARADPAMYEDPRLLDTVNKAREGAENLAGLIFTFVGIFTFYLPYMLTVSAFLFLQKPLLALCSVLVFAPVAVTQLIRAKVFSGLEGELAPLRRKYEAYEKAVTDRDFFKETRLLGNYEYLKGLFSGALGAFAKKSAGAERKTALWEAGMRVITLAGYMGILYLLFTSLLKGEITPGAFASVFAELGMMFSVMEEVICGHIAHMTKNLGTVRNFVEFLRLPERGGREAAFEGAPALSLEGACFRYPGADRDAVKNVNLTVRPGETLAIVGENGAGKTTLARMLIGLYLPTRGKSMINGEDMREVSMPALFRPTSAVFQKFMRYRMTLRDNVRLSRPDADAPAARALADAGLPAHSDCFPDGEDTVLSREFGGTDLSGGQWQRVAIARGLYRAHGAIILDEPTSAIDPLEETRVYQNFARLSADATAVVITHRMGSARIADRILVMKDGAIEEEGTHDHLMALGGHYAQMVRAQAQWYATEANPT